MISRSPILLDAHTHLVTIATQEMPDVAVVIVDSEGVIRHWDSGAQELFGYTIAEAEGKSLDLFVPDTDRPWRGDAYGAEILERSVRCSDGTVHPFAARLLFMKDPSDHAVGAAMVFERPGDPVDGAVRKRGWFDSLAPHRYATLTSRRRNGAIVPTTVWFAVHQDRVYVNTDKRSWKVKRIRNDPRVTLRPCSVRGRPRGQEVEGVASILPRDEQAGPDALIDARYRWRRRLVSVLFRERMDEYSELIEIRPPD